MNNNNDILKARILKIVGDSQGGVKAVTIVSHSVAYDESFDTTEDVTNAIQELVNSGDIAELKYRLPNYRTKSMYFPKGTQFVINK